MEDPAFIKDIWQRAEAEAVIDVLTFPSVTDPDWSHKVGEWLKKKEMYRREILDDTKPKGKGE
jgi:hypothetical protein